jgi:outer membrane protein assembly factor BamB
VQALDVKTQKIQWSYQFSDGSSDPPFSTSSLITADGSLYLALEIHPSAAGTALVALDGRTGKVQWQRSRVEAHPISLLVENGVMYTRVNFRGMVNGEKDLPPGLSALDARTGKELWKSNGSVFGLYDRDGMDITPTLLYMQGASCIQAVERSTGRLVWSSEQLGGEKISIGPIVGKDLVYAATATPVRGGRS